MKNEKVTRTWGIATVIVGAVICIAAAALSITSAAQMRENPAKNPPVTIQWQSQSDLEARFTAKLIEDQKTLKGKLDYLAGLSTPPDHGPWQKEFAGHFLKEPRLWANGEYFVGWEKVLPELHKIVRGSKDITIHFAWGMIEYVTYDHVKKPEAKDDVDFRIKVKVTFSASPGDNILEGSLSHRRVCLIEP